MRRRTSCCLGRRVNRECATPLAISRVRPPDRHPDEVLPRRDLGNTRNVYCPEIPQSLRLPRDDCIAGRCGEASPGLTFVTHEALRITRHWPRGGGHPEYSAM